MAANPQTGPIPSLPAQSLDGSDGWARDRAARSLTCLPFRRVFYEELSDRAISSSELGTRPDGSLLLFAALGADRAEDHFIWLIRLGVLRREVDGQGLTERVRLTPLGRSVISRWPGEIPRASRRHRLREMLLRHWPRL